MRDLRSIGPVSIRNPCHRRNRLLIIRIKPNRHGRTNGRAERARLAGFRPGITYRWSWFDPRDGGWSREISVKADSAGALQTPAFPGGGSRAARDVAAKILAPDAVPAAGGAAAR